MKAQTVVPSHPQHFFPFWLFFWLSELFSSMTGVLVFVYYSLLAAGVSVFFSVWIVEFIIEVLLYRSFTAERAASLNTCSMFTEVLALVS